MMKCLISSILLFIPLTVHAYNYIDQFDYLVNKYRTVSGTYEITRVDSLDECAYKRAKYVSVTGKFRHDEFYNFKCGHDKLRTENLAFELTEIESLKSWQLSEDHNKNLLGDYKLYGLNCYNDICVMLFM